MTMVAVLEDQLVPVADMRALRDRCGGTCQLVEISSMYGHDAFFKEAGRAGATFSIAHSTRRIPMSKQQDSIQDAHRACRRSRPTRSTAPSCRRST